jgi:hypothetical protein
MRPPPSGTQVDDPVDLLDYVDSERGAANFFSFAWKSAALLTAIGWA